MLDANQHNIVTFKKRISGYIDFHGFLSASNCWIFCGWICEHWPDGHNLPLSAHFQNGELTAVGTSVFFPRPDIGSAGMGILLSVPVSGSCLGLLLSMSLTLPNGRAVELIAANAELPLPDLELIQRAKHEIEKASAGPSRDSMLRLLSRTPFVGKETVSQLSVPIRIGLDEAFILPPNGLALVGWIAASSHTLRALRLRSGQLTTEIDLGLAHRIERQDVVCALSDQMEVDQTCGFLIALPHALAPECPTYLELESWGGEYAYMPIPHPKRSGLRAIQQLLSVVETDGADIGTLFDNLLGPAIESINRDRLALPVDKNIIDYGICEDPRHTIIVTLYGRIDYMEIQIALFSRMPEFRDTELIYVLDDPRQKKSITRLAESIYQRFLIPFRIIILKNNVGFSPANNIGLSLARGQHVCFLNSDVFTTQTDWLPTLCRKLDDNSNLGAVGPVLLFEDETIQHQGTTFSPNHTYENWSFPRHIQKGLRPSKQTGLVICEAITGACIVMRREDAISVGGFDERFILGDFEDTDLCLRIRQRGFTCAVDNDVKLFHLERQSQTSSDIRWRQNLTLYNAWVHQRRWFDERSTCINIPR